MKQNEMAKKQTTEMKIILKSVLIFVRTLKQPCSCTTCLNYYHCHLVLVWNNVSSFFLKLEVLVLQIKHFMCSSFPCH